MVVELLETKALIGGEATYNSFWGEFPLQNYLEQILEMSAPSCYYFKTSINWYLSFWLPVTMDCGLVVVCAAKTLNLAILWYDNVEWYCISTDFYTIVHILATDFNITKRQE